MDLVILPYSVSALGIRLSQYYRQFNAVFLFFDESLWYKKAQDLQLDSLDQLSPCRFENIHDPLGEKS